jgi:hypothetical protein
MQIISDSCDVITCIFCLPYTYADPAQDNLPLGIILTSLSVLIVEELSRHLGLDVV